MFSRLNDACSLATVSALLPDADGRAAAPPPLQTLLGATRAGRVLASSAGRESALKAVMPAALGLTGLRKLLPSVTTEPGEGAGVRRPPPPPGAPASGSAAAAAAAAASEAAAWASAPSTHSRTCWCSLMRHVRARDIYLRVWRHAVRRRHPQV